VAGLPVGNSVGISVRDAMGAVGDSDTPRVGFEDTGGLLVGSLLGSLDKMVGTLEGSSMGKKE